MENQKDRVDIKKHGVGRMRLLKQSLYRNWQKEKSEDSWKKYKESKQCAKKTIMLANESKQKEITSDYSEALPWDEPDYRFIKIGK